MTFMLEPVKKLDLASVILNMSLFTLPRAHGDIISGSANGNILIKFSVLNFFSVFHSLVQFISTPS